MKNTNNSKIKILTLAMLTSIGFGSVVQAQSIAGCSAGSFVEGTDSNQITTSGAGYTPKCLRVKVGATVTIAGSSRHPLSAMADIDQARNPFGGVMGAESAQTRTMTTPGLFGYFCEAHGDADGNGMAGVIMVVE